MVCGREETALQWEPQSTSKLCSYGAHSVLMITASDYSMVRVGITISHLSNGLVIEVKMQASQSCQCLERPGSQWQIVTSPQSNLISEDLALLNRSI